MLVSHVYERVRKTGARPEHLDSCCPHECVFLFSKPQKTLYVSHAPLTSASRSLSIVRMQKTVLNVILGGCTMSSLTPTATPLRMWRQPSLPTASKPGGSPRMVSSHTTVEQSQIISQWFPLDRFLSNLICLL